MKKDLKQNKYEFFFEVPLYKNFELTGNIFDFFNGEIDAYNPDRKTETTYDIFLEKVDNYDWQGFYKITLECKRYGDCLRFFITSSNGFVVKIGQYPSIADIQFAEMGKKYDKFLDREDLQEFKKAIGLSAHGIGAGSLVYLRRIFEKLIFNTYKEYQTELKITSIEFIQKKMSKKVEVLKKYLPSQLIKMKLIYPILSKGVHELTEQECLEFFPAVKLAIELILDQKIEIEIKKAKDKKVIDEINNIGKKL